MTTTRPHGDTEARATGLDATIQDGLAWVAEHRKPLGIAAAVLLLLGVAAAGVYESRRSARAETAAELAAIEADLAAGLGGSRQDALPAEPANADQARRAREAALSRMETFAAEHSGPLGRDARLRAAQLEADLAQLDAADARLQALVGELPDSDPRKGQALRLRGWVLEELDRPQEAATLYEQGAQLESYPARALLWIAASQVHTRLGDPTAALRALDRAIALQTDLGRSPQILRERAFLEAAIDVQSTAADPPPTD